uniref:Protein kinase domain-containing protein n=2 Tax=Chromera velia CCMP2878 TaxID=1169474 RepID=A0A0G4GQ97_9ALVE|eukprot:Cvel_22902.t2-p1 / transcript=Cvel_22902.t2 / gene=Cvel_22902 / organism=Chromera_velia_CCMP2878 / gene_product=hypothetical protein / transcript_product=hypothetical protein / location=Cvel_scaffold2301:8341-18128(-) / protein_length=1434 / sequence_SO=supercontig / SO=protein_coding / is_pseudo=false
MIPSPEFQRVLLRGSLSPLQFSFAEIQSLMASFGANLGVAGGLVAYDTLIDKLKADLTEQETVVLRQIFQKRLKPDRYNVAAFRDVWKALNPERHPEVVSQKKTAFTLLREMQEQLEGVMAFRRGGLVQFNKYVSWEEFLDFCRFTCACSVERREALIPILVSIWDLDIAPAEALQERIDPSLLPVDAHELKTKRLDPIDAEPLSKEAMLRASESLAVHPEGHPNFTSSLEGSPSPPADAARETLCPKKNGARGDGPLSEADSGLMDQKSEEGQAINPQKNLKEQTSLSDPGDAMDTSRSGEAFSKLEMRNSSGTKDSLEKREVEDGRVEAFEVGAEEDKLHPTKICDTVADDEAQKPSEAVKPTDSHPHPATQPHLPANGAPHPAMDAPPEMLKQFIEMMKGMSPDDLKRMQEMAANMRSSRGAATGAGVPSTATAGAGDSPSSSSSSPAKGSVESEGACGGQERDFSGSETLFPETAVGCVGGSMQIFEMKAESICTAAAQTVTRLSQEDCMLSFRAVTTRLEKIMVEGFSRKVLRFFSAFCEDTLMAMTEKKLYPTEVIAMSRNLVVFGVRVEGTEEPMVIKLRRGGGPSSAEVMAHMKAFERAREAPFPPPGPKFSLVSPPEILPVPSTAFSVVLEEDGGPTLSDLDAPLRGKPLQSFCRMFLRAVHCLHQTEYAHRDLKPSNVFPSGKLFDLGSVLPLDCLKTTVKIQCVEEKLEETDAWGTRQSFCVPPDAAKFLSITEEFLPPNMLLTLSGKLNGFPTPLPATDVPPLKDGQRVREMEVSPLGGKSADAWAAGLTILYAVTLMSLPAVLGVEGRAFQGKAWKNLSPHRVRMRRAATPPQAGVVSLGLHGCLHCDPSSSPWKGFLLDLHVMVTHRWIERLLVLLEGGLSHQTKKPAENEAAGGAAEAPEEGARWSGTTPQSPLLFLDLSLYSPPTALPSEEGGDARAAPLELSLSLSPSQESLRALSAAFIDQTCMAVAALSKASHSTHMRLLAPLLEPQAGAACREGFHAKEPGAAFRCWGARASGGGAGSSSGPLLAALEFRAPAESARVLAKELLSAFASDSELLGDTLRTRIFQTQQQQQQQKEGHGRKTAGKGKTLGAMMTLEVIPHLRRRPTCAISCSVVLQAVAASYAHVSAGLASFDACMRTASEAPTWAGTIARLPAVKIAAPDDPRVSEEPADVFLSLAQAVGEQVRQFSRIPKEFGVGLFWVHLAPVRMSLLRIPAGLYHCVLKTFPVWLDRQLDILRDWVKDCEGFAQGHAEKVEEFVDQKAKVSAAAEVAEVEAMRLRQLSALKLLAESLRIVWFDRQYERSLATKMDVEQNKNLLEVKLTEMEAEKHVFVASFQRALPVLRQSLENLQEGAMAVSLLSLRAAEGLFSPTDRNPLEAFAIYFTAEDPVQSRTEGLVKGRSRRKQNTTGAHCCRST